MATKIKTPFLYSVLFRISKLIGWETTIDRTAITKATGYDWMVIIRKRTKADTAAKMLQNNRGGGEQG